MKYEEIDKFDRYEYVEVCNCGKTFTVLTQSNDYPEYDTGVYVLCDCGEYVEFVLPVN